MSFLSSFEAWISHVTHTATAKEILAVGEDVGKQVVVSAAMAGLAAHARSGGDKAATEAAIKNSAIGTLSTVGVSASTTEIENLVAHISDSIHAPAQAEAPPAA